MGSELQEQYKELDTENLIRIVFLEATDYRPEAVEAAKKVLADRGITESSDCVRTTRETHERARKEINNEPLPKKRRIVFFICGMFFVPFFVAMFYIEHHRAKMGARRTKESWKWLWIGLGSMVLIHILAVAFLAILR